MAGRFDGKHPSDTRIALQNLELSGGVYDANEMV
jgi:hypothetical protein